MESRNKATIYIHTHFIEKAMETSNLNYHFDLLVEFIGKALFMIASNFFKMQGNYCYISCIK